MSGTMCVFSLLKVALTLWDAATVMCRLLRKKTENKGSETFPNVTYPGAYRDWTESIMQTAFGLEMTALWNKIF